MAPSLCGRARAEEGLLVHFNTAGKMAPMWTEKGKKCVSFGVWQLLLFLNCLMEGAMSPVFGIKSGEVWARVKKGGERKYDGCGTINKQSCKVCASGKYPPQKTPYAGMSQ